MKKFLKAVGFIIGMVIFAACVALIPVGSTKNLAKGWSGDSGDSCLIDMAQIFPDDVEAELTETIRNTSDELELNICIYLAGSEGLGLDDDATEAFAHNKYDDTFGEYTDGVLYYMDLSGGSSTYDFISTSGKATVMYQKDIDSIFTYLDYYLPASGQQIIAEDIRKAVEAFCGQLEAKKAAETNYVKCNDLYNYYSGSTFMVTKGRPYEKRLVLMLIMTAIAGIIVLIVHACIKSHYKFKSSVNPSVYLSREKTVFRVREDNFLRSHVTKVKIESSSGGGSRGGGGHSFGGSHGGGGHHR